MKNFIQHGDSLTVPAPVGGTISGNAYLIGSLFGVAATTQAAGADVVLKTTGIFELPKTSALAIALGDAVYWDDTAKVVNKTAAANTLIGYATRAAANPSATVRVRLNV